jgi:AcrR family transcriptional regulator
MKTSRKDQIVSRAIDLFARDGYRKVTVKRIAMSCKITEAALYKHFKSKEDIYRAVLHAIQNEVSADDYLAKLAVETDISKLLFGLARFISTSYLKHHRMIRLLLFSSLEGHSQAKQVYYSLRLPYIKFLAGKLDELIKAGIVRKVNSQITARCFVGMVFDCALNAKLWKGMAGKVFSHELTIKNNVPIFAGGLIKLAK